MGSNALAVVVTAEDGTTTQTYTVTVTRQQAQQTQSTDATLSGLTATSSMSVSGTFTALTLSPAFAAATTAYTATVGNSITHVKLTPTVNDSNATVKVGKGTSLTTVTSGTASTAIALDPGSNALNVEVTAQDGTTTRTYTVTVTRGRAALTNLLVTPGNARLDLSWDAGPSGQVAGYSVEYTSSATVANNADQDENANVAAGWVELQSGTSLVTATSYSITSLSNGTTYRVRVSAVLGDFTELPWAFGSGTPVAPTVPAAPTNLMVNPGNAKLDLSWTAPPGTLTGYDVHYTSAASGTVADSAAASGSNAGTAWVAVTRAAGAPDGDADDFEPCQRHHLPGAGARDERQRRRRLGVRLGHAVAPHGLALRPEPGGGGVFGNGDGEAVEGAFKRGDDSGDGLNGLAEHGGVWRCRWNDIHQHHHQRGPDHGHGHDPNEPGLGRKRRDLHGVSGHPAPVGDGGQPVLCDCDDQGRRGVYQGIALENHGEGERGTEIFAWAGILATSRTRRTG